MSTSAVWSAASSAGQAQALGRHLSRSGASGGGVTSQIAYTDRAGRRIIRKWDKNGVMIEEVVRQIKV